MAQECQIQVDSRKSHCGHDTNRQLPPGVEDDDPALAVHVISTIHARNNM